MLTFWRYGYDTTSISELTTAMGVTAPSIYTAFGNKKTLFIEAMQLYTGASGTYDETLAQAPTAREAAKNMLISACEKFTGSSTPRGCLLASSTASCSRDSLDVQRTVSKVRKAMTRSLRARIERDISASILPRNTDSASLATLTMALIQGLSVLSRDGMGRIELSTMIETAMTAWPKSISAEIAADPQF